MPHLCSALCLMYVTLELLKFLQTLALLPSACKEALRSWGAKGEPKGLQFPESRCAASRVAPCFCGAAGVQEPGLPGVLQDA